MRLFLCDDNVHYRLLARRVLESRGHTIIGEASNGQEALERAPAAAPDVLLLDLNMPVVNGWETLPRLREAMPGTRIVVLTTGQAPAERMRALDAGADGFVVKPDRVLTLPDALDAVLS